MERIELGTPDIARENIEKLGELFPQVLTEVAGEDGEIKRAVDFDALRDLLGDVAEDGRERYQFTWPGKRGAKAEARRPIAKTMRPCPEESVSWDTTENLYIEGDNLDALKILKETYAGKVQLIYIDPPYNTGHDFVYNDSFSESMDEYEQSNGDFDGESGRLVVNLETNGRFHSNWCSMIYPRLQLARDYLRGDGAIFISIDDHEVCSLTKIMDEIFGETNRIALICHKSRASVSNDKIISPNHNTVLFYAKDIVQLDARRKMIGLDPLLEGFDFDDEDGRGSYRLVPVDGPGGAKKGNPHYSFMGVEGYWRFSKETMQQKYSEGLVVKRGNSLYQKYYKEAARTTRRTATTWWEDGGLISTATSKLKKLMEGPSFDTPKPIELISRMIEMICFENRRAIILDFFSGSATTAHAVLECNAKDEGERSFILVQLKERCPQDSEAAKAGYSNICEIGKERIRRASDKIKKEIEEANKQLKLGEEPKKVPDIGFRVLKIDSSNFADTLDTPANTSQQSLLDFADNVKADRSDFDLLFEVLPKFRIPYSAKIEERNICGKRCFVVEGGQLVACFDASVGVDTIEAIAKMEPIYAVMRDASMADDATHANFEEMFRIYSPDTVRKVI